ncbi:MAG: hypothetical protein JGK17_11335 [Microcoleus sp. PH2017_10_PVI_O_A]|nr:hypothetical protein [Microcoleus sp. PH2017_10_PVI_O_A]MCC3479316.1 hypothetical protein [Microcoleus sp. PH2017_12_PCY_D_A]
MSSSNPIVRSNFGCCAIARRHRPASSNPKARSNVRDLQKYARQGYPEERSPANSDRASDRTHQRPAGFGIWSYTTCI